MGHKEFGPVDVPNVIFFSVQHKYGKQIIACFENWSVDGFFSETTIAKVFLFYFFVDGCGCFEATDRLK